ncbi:Uncharacterised protein [Mycobacteroides abscessus subsp. abscessus]|nr:Uncharacterised protein [Mycobacteroides abscessus subsp. abscessus]
MGRIPSRRTQKVERGAWFMLREEDFRTRDGDEFGTEFAR